MKKQTFLIWSSFFMSFFSVWFVLHNTSNLKGSSFSEDVETKSDFTSLRTTVENQQKAIDKLANETWNTKLDLGKTKFNLTSLQHRYDRGFFTPTDSSFRFIESNYGKMMVSLENAQKFGDGYKLDFQFGNPTSMIFSGLKGKITWKPKTDYNKYYEDEKYSKEIDEKTHSKEFQVLDDLRMGTWNEVPIAIGPANEETIGEISISDLEISSVKMWTKHLRN